VSHAAAVAPMNPYPGLRPFRQDEAELFFGRDDEVDAMVDRLAATRFLAVVGPSGSGKSSLVGCGLLPALRLGRMAGAGSAWRIAQFRPGSRPFDALARALAVPGVLFDGRDAPESGAPVRAEIVEAGLRLSGRGLIDVVEQAPLAPDANLLVVVDQFEELFRDPQGGAGDEATAFVSLLLEAAEQADNPIRVVATLRADFLGECTRFAGLVGAINAGLHLVSRLTREERREVIVGPVALTGAQISPVLVTRLVNDANDSLDQLALLQHALNRTWAYWAQERGGQAPLDFEHYEAIGAIAGALDTHAERAYSELPSDQQGICERLFKALTDKANDPRGVRRPGTLGELSEVTGAATADLVPVIDAFRRPGRAFLMPPSDVPLDAATVIDISHESLMRTWQRLERWAADEAESARLFRQLAEEAELHARGHADVLRSARLQRALDVGGRNWPNVAWARRYHPGWATAQRFLEASLAQAADQRTRVRRMRAGVVFGVMLALLLASVFVYRMVTLA
jgi:hypothetical protein